MKATLADRRPDHGAFSCDSDLEQANELHHRTDNTSKYRETIARLQRRCEHLSQNNERLVRRLHCVKRITNRKKRDVDLLKTRLDVYNDEWRTAQPDPITKIKMPTNLTPTGKVRKTRAKKNNGLAQNSPQPADQPAKPMDAKLTKRKRVKADKEKDPNAPKRPANPFFQFCQEQRAVLMDELNNGLQPGQSELSKQELTRRLAERWRSLDPDEKQIYVNKYENSKLKYHQDMLTYKKEVFTLTYKSDTMSNSSNK